MFYIYIYIYIYILRLHRTYLKIMCVEETKVMIIPRQSSPVQIKIDQRQPENVEHFSYLSSMKANDARCKRYTKSRIASKSNI
jgi:hypothetical protein